MSGLAFYAVWNKLRTHDQKEDPWSLDRQNHVLRRWKGFFTPTSIALQRMAMLEFAKVFDTDPRTASLVVLLEEARRDNALVPHAQVGDLEAISNRLAQAKDTHQALKKLRNQNLAHADGSPDPLPPLMNQKVERLAEDIKYAFNRLSSAHDGSVWSWEYALDTTHRHTTEVLGLLVEEIERREAEHDDEMVEIVLGRIRKMETTLGGPIETEEIESVVQQFGLTAEQARRVQLAQTFKQA
jgi:hypothetical protein